MMADARVVIDGAKIQELLSSPQGPVLRYLSDVGQKVQDRARDRIRDRLGAWSSQLAASVVKRFERDGRGAYVSVGSDQTKTRPHPIDGNPLLVFFWPKAGRVVFLPHVNHPGSEMGP